MLTLKNSISYKLLIKVILIYVAVTMFVIIGQVYTDLHYQKKHVQAELNILSHATTNSFSNALWDMNRKQIEIEAYGLIKLPLIQAIKISDKNNTVLLEKKRQQLS